MKKILLVNTSRYFFDEGKNILNRNEFKILMAPTAVKALVVHREESVNLIVAELNMPDMGGDALCKAIREGAESRNVSIILIHQDNPAESARAASSGANICLHKPFTARTLLDHVEKLLTISVRKGYRVLLRAKVKGEQEDIAFFCTSQNLSTSGILIETDRALKVGEHISCSFYLPGASQITAEGEVARTEISPSSALNYYGVRFTRLSVDHKHAIAKFITDASQKA
jgi:DNA-binding response OmpR family regulator